MPPRAPLTSVSSQFYPYLEAGRVTVVPHADASAATSPADGLPIPPRGLQAGYGAGDEDYLACGREHHQMMMKIITESGFELERGGRILDFGCAGGRMIRCFKGMAEDHEIWGVDIRADHISWCQRFLSPPFRFATVTTHPHLPFEDNSFSFIYACSVFTHIGDLEDTWLLELRRVLRKGGRLFATVHDNHTIDLIRNCPPGEWLYNTPLRHQVLEIEASFGITRSGFGMVSITLEPGNHQVFHDREFLRGRWGRFLSVLSIHPEAHAYQTAVLLCK
jgi:SAM-dependent methyltransferase